MTTYGVVSVRPVVRTGLEKTRDVLLCIFCVLASVIMVVGIASAVYFVKELGEQASTTKYIEPEDCETVRRPECSPVVED